MLNDLVTFTILRKKPHELCESGLAGHVACTDSAGGQGNATDLVLCQVAFFIETLAADDDDNTARG